MAVDYEGAEPGSIALDALLDELDAAVESFVEDVIGGDY